MVKRVLTLVIAFAFVAGLSGVAIARPAYAVGPDSHAATLDHCAGHAAKKPGLAPACCVACTLVATLPMPQTIAGSPVTYPVAFAVPKPDAGHGVLHRPDPFPPKGQPLG